MTSVATIFEHFDSLTDPRIDRHKLHSIHEMVVVALCAAICGPSSRRARGSTVHRHPPASLHAHAEATALSPSRATNLGLVPER